jgi:hypothetical protein
MSLCGKYGFSREEVSMLQTATAVIDAARGVVAESGGSDEDGAIALLSNALDQYETWASGIVRLTLGEKAVLIAIADRGEAFQIDVLDRDGGTTSTYQRARSLHAKDLVRWAGHKSSYVSGAGKIQVGFELTERGREVVAAIGAP